MTWRFADTGRTSAAVKQRLIAVDTARAFALFGMMIAHTGFIAAEQGWIQNTLVAVSDERSRLLFAVCAGLGLGFLTGGVRPPGKAAALLGQTPESAPPDPRSPYRLQLIIRAVVLLILGFSLTALGPMVHVILDEYGIAFLLAAPLVFAPAWLLLTLGLVVIPAVSFAAVTAIETGLLTLPAVFEIPIEILFLDVYPVSTWLAVLLIGVGIVRLDLHKLSTALTIFITGVIASAVLLPVSHLLVEQHFTAIFGWSDTGQAWQAVPSFLPAELAFHAAELCETLGNIALGFTLVAALLLITLHTPQGFAKPFAAILRPITVTGSMPLTIYTLHVVALTIIVALDPGGEPLHKSWTTTWLMIVAAIVFANLWRWLLGQGPLERLMSTLSDRKHLGTTRG